MGDDFLLDRRHGGHNFAAIPRLLGLLACFGGLLLVHLLSNVYQAKTTYAEIWLFLK